MADMSIIDERTPIIKEENSENEYTYHTIGVLSEIVACVSTLPFVTHIIRFHDKHNPTDGGLKDNPFAKTSCDTGAGKASVTGPDTTIHNFDVGSGGSTKATRCVSDAHLTDGIRELKKTVDSVTDTKNENI